MCCELGINLFYGLFICLVTEMCSVASYSASSSSIFFHNYLHDLFRRFFLESSFQRYYFLFKYLTNELFWRLCCKYTNRLLVVDLYYWYGRSVTAVVPLSYSFFLWFSLSLYWRFFYYLFIPVQNIFTYLWKCDINNSSHF